MRVAVKPKKRFYADPVYFASALRKYEDDRCDAYNNAAISEIPFVVLEDTLRKNNIMQAGCHELQAWRLNEFRQGHGVRMTPKYRPWSTIVVDTPHSDSLVASTKKQRHPIFDVPKDVWRTNLFIYLGLSEMLAWMYVSKQFFHYTRAELFKRSEFFQKGGLTIKTLSCISYYMRLAEKVEGLTVDFESDPKKRRKRNGKALGLVGLPLGRDQLKKDLVLCNSHLRSLPDFVSRHGYLLKEAVQSVVLLANRINGSIDCISLIPTYQQLEHDAELREVAYVQTQVQSRLAQVHQLIAINGLDNIQIVAEHGKCRLVNQNKCYFIMGRSWCNDFIHSITDAVYMKSSISHWSAFSSLTGDNCRAHRLIVNDVVYPDDDFLIASSVVHHIFSAVLSGKRNLFAKRALSDQVWEKHVIQLTNPMFVAQLIACCENTRRTKNTPAGIIIKWPLNVDCLMSVSVTTYMQSMLYSGFIYVRDKTAINVYHDVEELKKN